MLTSLAFRFDRTERAHALTHNRCFWYFRCFLYIRLNLRGNLFGFNAVIQIKRQHSTCKCLTTRTLRNSTLDSLKQLDDVKSYNFDKANSQNKMYCTLTHMAFRVLHFNSSAQRTKVVRTLAIMPFGDLNESNPARWRFGLSLPLLHDCLKDEDLRSSHTCCASIIPTNEPRLLFGQPCFSQQNEGRSKVHQYQHQH